MKMSPQNEMMSIHRYEVPFHLRHGTFYAGLSEEDFESFEVPVSCTKKDLSLQSSADLMYLVRSLRFWGIEDMSIEIILYLIPNKYLLKLVDAEFKEYGQWWTMIARISCVQTEETIAVAIKVGFPLHIVQDLFELGGFPVTSECCDVAASVDAVDILMYLHVLGCPLEHTTTEATLEFGSLKCLKYLRGLGCPLYSSSINRAARAGKLEMVKYLFSIGIPFHQIYTMQYAAASGQLDLVQYLFEQGCLWSEEVCHQFAFQGNIEGLQYAHLHGCPWGPYVCAMAAMQGHLHCLAYAHTNGCAWDEDTTYHAAVHARFACLRYARDHGCPVRSGTVTLSTACASWDGFCYFLESVCISCNVLAWFRATPVAVAPL